VNMVNVVNVIYDGALPNGACAALIGLSIRVHSRGIAGVGGKAAAWDVFPMWFRVCLEREPGNQISLCVPRNHQMPSPYAMSARARDANEFL
jgi:hypothetical protein